MANNFLAQNLQFLRKQRKMSQQMLAEALGLSRSNIASYENAKAEPRATMLLRICRYFDVPLAYLVDHPLDEEALSNQENTRQKLDKLLQSRQLDAEIFSKRSDQLRKIIEGMKAYHELKKEQLDDPSEVQQAFFKDYEYLLTVMESLVHSNDELLRLVQETEEVRY
ncbi:MAG: helix-turn-helix transcriptional regulator [Bacteroidetes bacterium]|nr:helix-turn-helix transcriptional regulator [Bacteroidota bacterium]